MRELLLRLRHGTADPVDTRLDGQLLERISNLKTADAIREILQSVPERNAAYARAMLETMGSPDSVTELANLDGEEIVTLNQGRDEIFADVLSRLARQRAGRVETLSSLELGTARLEKGGFALTATPGEAAVTAPPRKGANLPEHPFFAVAKHVPIVVHSGAVWRVSCEPPANAQPHLALRRRRYALDYDQSLAEYDLAYFQDYGAIFDEAISVLASSEAEKLSRQSIKASACYKEAEVAKFIVTCLIPVLKRFERDSLAAEQLREGGSPRIDHTNFWRPQVLPLTTLFRSAVLISQPYVFTTKRSRGLLAGWFGPALRLPRETYVVDRRLSLEDVERWYAALLFEAIENEVPDRASSLLANTSKIEVLLGEVGALEAARRRSAETGTYKSIYEDRYHKIAVYRGTFRLYRRVPEFVIRCIGTKRLYRCGPGWLWIELTSADPKQIFYRGCVRASGDIRHPLVQGSSHSVLMDRCDGDIDALRNSSDVANNLVKHLNDAKLMLEIGWNSAPCPGRRAKTTSADEVKILELPVYEYRHKQE